MLEPFADGLGDLRIPIMYREHFPNGIGEIGGVATGVALAPLAFLAGVAMRPLHRVAEVAHNYR